MPARTRPSTVLAERVRCGLDYFRKRGLVKRYGWRQAAGYMWAEGAGELSNRRYGVSGLVSGRGYPLGSEGAFGPTGSSGFVARKL